MMLWMLAVLIGYFVKGVAGFGNTLVVNSVMTFSMSNAALTPVELMLCVPTNMTLAIANRRGIRWRLALPPLAMVLAGDVLGVYMLANVQVDALKMVFGAVLILLGIEALWREHRGVSGDQVNPMLLTALGVTAGVLCGLFGVGALLAAYFARVTKDDASFKGSMCMIFAVENLFRVAAYGVSGLLSLTTLTNAAMLAPFMAVGLFLGMRLSGRLNARLVRLVVNVLLMFSGVALLATNL